MLDSSRALVLCGLRSRQLAALTQDKSAGAAGDFRCPRVFGQVVCISATNSVYKTGQTS